MSERQRKSRMPTGMYVGSAWIGFALLMFLCWILAFFRASDYIRQGVGSAGSFVIILNVVAIFGFGLPMILGILTLRRAGRRVRDEQAAPDAPLSTASTQYGEEHD